MNPRQFFHACIQIIPVERLSKIWGVNQRQLYRYGADPIHCADWQPNPLERLMETITELKVYNRHDIAMHGARLVAGRAGCVLQQPPESLCRAHHMQALRAVTDYLDAHDRGADYVELAPKLEAVVAAVEGLWMQRRAEGSPASNGCPEKSWLIEDALSDEEIDDPSVARREPHEINRVSDGEGSSPGWLDKLRARMGL